MPKEKKKLPTHRVQPGERSGFADRVEAIAWPADSALITPLQIERAMRMVESEIPFIEAQMERHLPPEVHAQLAPIRGLFIESLQSIVGDCFFSENREPISPRTWGDLKAQVAANENLYISSVMQGGLSLDKDTQLALRVIIQQSVQHAQRGMLGVKQPTDVMSPDGGWIH